MSRTKRYGILRVVLTTLVIRTAMILFTLNISSFRNNHIPNYYYTSHTVNVNLDTLHPTSNNLNNNNTNNQQKNTDNTTKNKNTYKLKSKPYLKAKYIHPVTTIYNFVDNYNRINHTTHVSNTTDRSNKDNYLDLNNNTNKIDNKLNRRLRWLTGFVSWDGERFLKNVVFQLTYTSEDSCAFFPLFPLLIYWLRDLVVFLLKNFFNFEVKDGLTSVYLILLIGVVLNNLLSLLNNVLIYLIVTQLLEYNLFNNGYYRKIICNTNNDTKSSRTNKGLKESQSDSNETTTENNGLYLRRIDKIGCLACIVYNLSPGFIFTTSFYTEPLYSLFYYLTLLAFMKLYTLNNSKNNKNKSDILLVLTTVGLAFVSGFVRSNSILFAILLFFYKLYKCPLLNYIYNLLNNTTDRSNKDNVNKTLLLFKFLGFWSLNLLYLLVILTPFFLIQLYGYFLYCNKLTLEQYSLFSKFHYFVLNVFRNPKLVYNILTNNTTERSNKDNYLDLNNYLNFDFNLLQMNNQDRNKLNWCSNKFPSIYKHIQNRYWGIELFYSFRSWNNFVNLIYSFPSLLMLFMYVFNFTKYYLLPNLFGTNTTTSNNIDSTTDRSDKDSSKAGDNKDKKDVVKFIETLLTRLLKTINNYEFGLFVHFLVTLNSFMLFSHIQIIFRQSLCLVQYLIQFSLMLFDLATTFNQFLSKNTSNTTDRNNKDNKDKSKSNKRLFVFLGNFFLYLYNSVLCFVGIILFSNFIGWT